MKNVFLALVLILFGLAVNLQASPFDEEQSVAPVKSGENSSVETRVVPDLVAIDVRNALASQKGSLKTSLPWKGDAEEVSQKEGNKLAARLIRKGGKELLVAILGMPKSQARSSLAGILRSANPGLSGEQLALLCDAMLNTLVSYRTAIDWVPPAGKDGFALLPKEVREALKTRMHCDKLDSKRFPDFERWYKARYKKPLPGSKEARNSAYASYYYNEVMDPLQRVSLSCMAAKLSSEGLWPAIQSVNFVNDQGVFLFTPVGGQATLKKTLEKKGYGDWWAASKGNPWGVRDHEQGVQFHIRGSDSDDKVNIHLDLDNPGDPPGRTSSPLAELPGAFSHLFGDLWGWEKTHTAPEILRQLERSGIKVPRPS